MPEPTPEPPAARPARHDAGRLRRVVAFTGADRPAILLIVAATLGLIVAIAAYDFFDASNRSYVRETDRASAQNAGRVALNSSVTVR